MLVELTTAHLDGVAAIEAVSSLAPWSLELFAGELRMPAAERHWLVALVGPDVVGFGGMMIVGEEAHLMNIAVHPGRRRGGIARSLLTQLIEDVVGRGTRHLTLEVRTDNAPALKLYHEYGFESGGERKDYYGPGSHAAILWARDIDHPTHPARQRRVKPTEETP